MTERAKQLAFGLALLLGIAGALPASGQGAPGATIVYITRHAERASEDYDSPLAPEGTARAELIVRMLGEAGITHLHSTAFLRTQRTVAPLAARLGLTVQDYDAASQPALVARIRAASGRHLVVGHSNTVPELVRLLGGDPGGPIATDEHDRLYIVTIAPDGSVTTSLLRYGSARPYANRRAAGTRPAVLCATPNCPAL